MPFKSQAQARLFFAKERRKELPKGTAKHWAHATKDIKKLPQHVKKKKKRKLKKTAFWQGFMKRADANIGDGGTGFTGAGKGNLIGSLDWDEYSGTKPSFDEAPSSSSDGTTDKSLLDHERNPRDFSPFQNGPELEDENGTHIRY